MTRRDALLERFAPLMADELAANAWKGDGWREETLDALSFEVLYHAAKLDLARAAGDKEAVAELAADVANGAAMLADAAGCLDDRPAGLALEPVLAKPQGGYEGGAAFGSLALRRVVEAWMRLLPAELDDDETVRAARVDELVDQIVGEKAATA